MKAVVNWAKWTEQLQHWLLIVYVFACMRETNYIQNKSVNNEIECMSENVEQICMLRFSVVWVHNSSGSSRNSTLKWTLQTIHTARKLLTNTFAIRNKYRIKSTQKKLCNVLFACGSDAWNTLIWCSEARASQCHSWHLNATLNTSILNRKYGFVNSSANEACEIGFDSKVEALFVPPHRTSPIKMTKS